MSMFWTAQERCRRIREMEMALSLVRSRIHELHEFRKGFMKHLKRINKSNRKDELNKPKYGRLFFAIQRSLWDWKYLSRKFQEKLNEYLETEEVIAQAKTARMMTLHGWVESKQGGSFIRKKPQKERITVKRLIYG